MLISKIPFMESQKTKRKTINWFVLKNALFSKTMEVVKNPRIDNWLKIIAYMTINEFNNMLMEWNPTI